VPLKILKDGLREAKSDDKPIDEFEVGSADQASALQEVAHIVIPFRNLLECLAHNLLLFLFGLPEKTFYFIIYA
jgi:hypothetical protein